MELAFNVMILINYLLDIVKQMLTVMIQIVYRVLINLMEVVQVAKHDII